MTGQIMMPAAIMASIRARLGDRLDDYRVPPPVFIAMQGEFVAFDPEARELKTRFPVLEQHLNPYGSMQGGIVAAAIDNTLGPLSLLLAPPNVTRRLQIKYSRPATPDLGHIIVVGRLLDRQGQRLNFSAEVRDPAGLLLASAQGDHWILDPAGA